MSKYEVKTKYPIAVESMDHVHPAGTYDCSVGIGFNIALEKLVGEIRLLDLGCAGGTVVESFLVMGHDAIGLEGSNFAYQPQNERPVERIADHAWDRIPDNLFNCDITKDFEILKDGKTPKFNVISSWEFFEHIEKDDLEIVMSHIEKYIEPGGIIVGSIGDFPEGERHRTVESVDWWKNFFELHGYEVMNKDYFDGPWIRGRGLWKKNRAPGEEGFNYIVRKK